jgi:hypothetical protein
MFKWPQPFFATQLTGVKAVLLWTPQVEIWAMKNLPYPVPVYRVLNRYPVDYMKLIIHDKSLRCITL